MVLYWGGGGAEVQQEQKDGQKGMQLQLDTGKELQPLSARADNSFQGPKDTPGRQGFFRLCPLPLPL